MLHSDIAKRKRKCHHCGRDIKPGEVHLITTSSGKYTHNICIDCVRTVLQSIDYTMVYGQF